MRKIVLISLLFLFKNGFCQLAEDFSNPDLLSSPAWEVGGSGTDFTIINGQLRSNATTLNSSFYLSTLSTLSVNCKWELYCNLKFNTSGANYVDIYLLSDKADLRQASINGYFIRIGGTDDDICLFRRSGTLSAAVKLIDGPNGTTNSSNNILKIVIERTSDGFFTLKFDASGTGQQYTTAGTATDLAFVDPGWFGIYIQQSTASFVQKHFFDDIFITALGGGTSPTQPVPSAIEAGDILISEVLFNPGTGGSDFLEVYNNSGAAIDLSMLQVATTDASGNQTVPKNVVNKATSAAPGSYWVFTANPGNLMQHYQVKHPGQVINTVLPAFKATSGSVILLSGGTVVDRLDYSDKMHMPLFKEVKGVSLERISFDLPANRPGNFTSASAIAGYATPTYRNSATAQQVDATVVIGKRLSPDNDGIDDLLPVSYDFPEPGNMGNITVYTDRGKPIKRLAGNSNLGTSGMVFWDGTDDNNALCRTGIYILVFEVYDLNGRSHRYKEACVLANVLK